MIPRVLFLYWGGRKLSWLRYLTVVSFAKHNPDWSIKVYYPTQPTVGNSWTTDEQIVKYTGEDYFDKLSEYAELIPFDMAELGLGNDRAEVHKSDLFRLWALVKYGGVYSDFDILYTKPMPDISKKKSLYCHHPDNHYAIGLLACGAGDSNFNGLLELGKLATGDKYQALGSTLWEKGLENVKLDGWNIPESLIYSHNWYGAEELFTEQGKLPKDAIGIHWYGGSITSGNWENLLNEERYTDYESTICDIIKDIL
jgi:hypothetical protein